LNNLSDLYDEDSVSLLKAFYSRQRSTDEEEDEEDAEDEEYEEYEACEDE